MNFRNIYTLQAFKRALFLLPMMLFALAIWSQCNNPSAFGTINAPTSPTPVTITTCAFGGEYSTINNCVAGSTYAFTGSGGIGNFLTVRQGSPGGTVLSFGFTPVSATCTVSGPLYLHVNTDAACGTDGSCHTLTVACSSCGAPPPGQCTNTSAYGSATINTLGAVVTISTCSFAGEYSTISGAVAGQTLRFTSSVSTDNITIHSGTYNGPVIAFGITALTFANTYTGTLYAHWNTASCGSEFSCRTTTVQCTSCMPCTNTSAYGSATINTTGAVVTISTCSFAGEYSTISGAVAGQNLKFTSSVATDVITIHSGTYNGPVIANGTTPLTFANTYTGTLYAHWNTPGCGSDFACRTTTVQCTNCAIDPCNPTTSLSCGASTTINQTGTGIWNPLGCPYSTPGVEKVFLFTAPTTGTYTLQVTAATGGYVDYMFKAASAGCSSTGWTCIGDISLPGTRTFSLTGGTQYYILADPEVITTISHTFQVNCPTPTISMTCPAATTVGCASSVPAPNPALVTATSNCPTSPTVTVSFVSDVTSNFICANKYTITRTYQGTDLCGNIATCTQVITVNDITPPVITTCPSALTVSCASQVPAATPSSVFATDGCGGTITYTFVSDVITNQTCTNRYTLTRTYRATDVCGNSSTCAQIITVNDITAPTITCPSALLVSCANEVPANNPASLVATDGCAGTVTKTFVGDVISNQTCSNRYTITRTYRATDVCGNSATCTQTITVNDLTKPTINNAPANITIECDQAIPPVPNVTATDNCVGGTPTLTFTSVSTKSPYPSLCAYISYKITRTWIATDVCGNSTSKVQVVTIKDSKPPVFISTPPANITVECDEDGSNDEDPIAVDNCDKNPSMYLDTEYFPYLNECVESYIVRNTWTVGDRCGNTATFVQNIYVVDTEAPEILNCPKNITIYANAGVPVTWKIPTASDYCDGIIPMVQTQGPPPGSTFQPGTTTQIAYSATDGCGNVGICKFTVTVIQQIGKEGNINNDPIHNEGYTALFQNIPNPFEGTTKIGFNLAADQEASLKVYSVDGKLVKEYSGMYNSGLNEVNIQEGDLPSSGMYFYELNTNGFRQTMKMFFVK